MIQSILIANRGEIASRIIRTCRKMGIRSVVVYSDADRNAPFVTEADQAVSLGGNAPVDSYLSFEKILDAAKRAAVDAIHPGYGFLSENAEFARACDAEGIVFIGPNPDAIAAMGSKAAAKQLMRSAGIPVVPGYDEEDQTFGRFQQEAERIGYPVLLKAAAGGGGKGMRIVIGPEGLSEAFIAAKSEAQNAFSDDRLILEKYFSNVRHIEFQVFGDRVGNVIHLLERECTIQRRYQKIIEESPSPALEVDLRQKMGDVAIRAAKALHYDNAGTVEFILADDQLFYFLEINTRLQVEHPVTELITGLDLVEMQIRMAEGEALPYAQSDIKGHGYALECRLYAEDSGRDFMPGTGKVIHWKVPEMEGLRVDAGIQIGSEVSVYYDPLLAKIVVWGESRATAHRKMAFVLREMSCLGVVTNRMLLLSLLQSDDFKSGSYNTHFLGTWSDDKVIPESAIHHACIAAMLFSWHARAQARTLLRGLPSGWRNSYSEDQFESYRLDDRLIRISYRLVGGHFQVQVDGTAYRVRSLSAARELIAMEVEGLFSKAEVVQDALGVFWIKIAGNEWQLQKESRFPTTQSVRSQSGYLAQMPSQVLKVLVQVGQKVHAGERLLVLSSMKMENTLLAETAGVIAEIFVLEGQAIEAKTELLRIEPIPAAEN